MLRGSVLEIGAQCGAVTRWLGESARRVVATEISSHQADVAALRCHALRHVSILNTSLAHLSGADSFDAMVLIGPAAQAATATAAATRRTLDCAAARLHDDGVLILAVYNPIGLNHFLSGASAAMHALGRQAIEQMLGQAGFTSVRALYPFPNHQTPHVIVSEAGVEQPTPWVTELVSRSAVAPDPSPCQRHMSDEAAWLAVAENKLLGGLANSFLLIASKRGGRLPFTQDTLAWTFTTQTRRAFARETWVQKTPAGIELLRRRLYPEAAAPVAQDVILRLQDDRVPEGTLLITRLTWLLNRPLWSAADIAAWAQPWHALLTQHCTADNHVPATLFNCIPTHTVQGVDGEVTPFNLQWQSAKPMPKAFVLTRGLGLSLVRYQSVAPAAVDTPLALRDLVAAVLDHLGEAITPAQYHAYVQQEQQLGRLIMGDGYPSFADHCLRPRLHQKTVA